MIQHLRLSIQWWRIFIWRCGTTVSQTIFWIKPWPVTSALLNFSRWKRRVWSMCQSFRACSLDITAIGGDFCLTRRTEYTWLRSFVISTNGAAGWRLSQWRLEALPHMGFLDIINLAVAIGSHLTRKDGHRKWDQAVRRGDRGCCMGH